LRTTCRPRSATWSRSCAGTTTCSSPAATPWTRCSPPPPGWTPRSWSPPDDTTASRGETEPSPRDNVVLEFGLFAGVHGRERTYLLATGPLRLPTDVLGLTRLRYRERTDGDLRAAVSDAALQVEERVRRLGPLPRGVGPAGSGRSPLDREVDLLVDNAVAQGWSVKTNSATTLRLVSPRGRAVTLAKGRPESTRADLRRFAAELRAAGLRVNSALRRPAEQSPF
jgi:hypothetical protein